MQDSTEFINKHKGLFQNHPLIAFISGGARSAFRIMYISAYVPFKTGDTPNKALLSNLGTALDSFYTGSSSYIAGQISVNAAALLGTYQLAHYISQLVGSK